MSDETRAMTEIDPATGYPPGYEPGIWRCLKCGVEFHDSEQRWEDHVAWDVDPECPPCHQTMVRVDKDASEETELLWRIQACADAGERANIIAAALSAARAEGKEEGRREALERLRKNVQGWNPQAAVGLTDHSSIWYEEWKKLAALTPEAPTGEGE